MSTNITVTGFVATAPKHTQTSSNTVITSFRLGSSERFYNKTSNEWESTETSWFSVSAFRYLAANSYATLRKGDRVLVTGRLRVRPWEAGEKSGIDVEIDADAIGPDLNWAKADLDRRERETPASAGDGAPTSPDEPADALEAAVASPGAGSASGGDDSTPF